MKKYLTALLYAIETPVGVWTGLEIDHQHYIKSCLLIAVLSALVFFGVLLWFKAQTDEINNSKPTNKGNIR